MRASWIFGIILYFIFAHSVAPLDVITIDEYGFGSGLVHGFFSLALLILKGCGAEIVVMAVNHAITYTIGFILGCVVLFIVFLVFLFDVLL